MKNKMIYLLFILIFFSACSSNDNTLFNEEEINFISFGESGPISQSLIPPPLYTLSEEQDIQEFVEILNNAEEFNPSNFNQHNYIVQIYNGPMMFVYIERDTNFGYFKYEDKNFKFKSNDVDKIFEFISNN